MKLYFNNAFSALSYSIQWLRRDWPSDDLSIVISHSRPDPYLEAVADHFEVEPAGLDDAAYTQYCVDMCRQHSVDVMIPRKRVTVLARSAGAFERAGIRVMWSASADQYARLDDKAKTLRSVRDAGIMSVPNPIIVNDKASFTEGFKRLSQSGDQVCMKPNIGVGGRGFRIIDRRRTRLDDVFSPDPLRVGYDTIMDALDETRTPEPILLNTYLDGDEYSVDCLAHRGQLLYAIPRMYIDKHHQRIDDVPDLAAYCQRLVSHFELDSLFNIQFRQHRGQWHLIEINPRMAAGMHRTRFSGPNLLAEALILLEEGALGPGVSVRWDCEIIKKVGYVNGDMSVEVEVGSWS
ncbi:MAG: hypothetical protein CMH52_07400 [Myxococcales bacterium]|nr:hypothetical protein [Myxococcales bacterium]